MTTTTNSTTTPTSVATSARGRTAVRVGILSAVVFTVLIFIAGLLDPGYSLRSEGISALSSVESESAGLMITAFAFLGLTAGGAGIGLIQTLRGRLAKATGILVLFAGVASAAEMFFRQSCSTLEAACLARESAGDVSGEHVLHNLIALPLFVSLVVAGFLLVGAVRRNPAVRNLRGRVLIAAFAGLGFFIWFGSEAYASNGGLVERGLVLVTFGLPLAVAWIASRRGVAVTGE